MLVDDVFKKAGFIRDSQIMQHYAGSHVESQDNNDLLSSAFSESRQLRSSASTDLRDQYPT